MQQIIDRKNAKPRKVFCRFLSNAFNCLDTVFFSHIFLSIFYNKILTKHTFCQDLYMKLFSDNFVDSLYSRDKM